MKITAYDPLYPMAIGGGTTTLVSGASGGSNSGYGGDVVGTPGDLSVVGLRRTVSLASNIAPSAAVGNVLTLISVGGTPVAQFTVPSNSGGSSFGSNATRVSKNSSVGALTTSAREDHIHDGIGTITASASNTAGRGTLNIRAGDNVSIGWTDTDGDGLLDTATFNASAPAAAGGGSGSSIPEQDLAYPTSASGDDDLMASTAGWSDVGSNAWDTFSSDGRILTLIIKGASKSATLRKTLGTTKAAAFDFRMSILPNIDWWSGTGDVLLHVRFRTSGGTTVAAMRFSPQNVQTRNIALGGAGSGAYTESTSIAIPHGLSTVIRCTRDGSNNVLFYYGLGSTPFALLPVVQPGSGTYHAPLTFSSSGTIARVEIEVTTPAGPNAASEWGCKVDYFQSV